VVPETQYARSGAVSIAYQVLGDGPTDLVFVPGFVSNLELGWDWPPLAAFYGALASFARLILFDKRGTGLSDRVKEMPTLKERMEDIRAVMDAAGCERAAVVGVSEGAPLSIAFAVSSPERVLSLVLYAPLARATRAPDYPWAEPAEWWEQVVERFERSWGSPEYMRADVAWRAPSAAADEMFGRWWASYRRLGASPGAAADLARMNARIDVRELLPRVSVPTLVLARAGDRVVAVEHARFVAERIPGASYLELPGEDHLPFVGDATAIVRAIATALSAPAEDVDVEREIAAYVSDEPPEEEAVSVLTAGELEVLRWVARGYSNAEIATALYVAESTVRKHLQNAYRKLGVPSRTGAVAKLWPSQRPVRRSTGG